MSRRAEDVNQDNPRGMRSDARRTPSRRASGCAMPLGKNNIDIHIMRAIKPSFPFASMARTVIRKKNARKELGHGLDR
ncbi:hypothetical protein M404DRAFT_994293 [Pisolithus tinctorius Marx 270]|uniref:Uncharacterized protein n=1 Tax=Pisolithus tinctorius Marx 270 TaxID=870435 RepID=A0A0C3PSC5_PISTI|nr:hypothetical protein M404DRAFT_994293 [Pisolithus tinctorius Marx 270]